MISSLFVVRFESADRPGAAYDPGAAVERYY
jgi:hypothetical protein